MPDEALSPLGTAARLSTSGCILQNFLGFLSKEAACLNEGYLGPKTGPPLKVLQYQEKDVTLYEIPWLS